MWFHFYNIFKQKLFPTFKGLPNPNYNEIFEGLDETNGFYTSKDYLLQVNMASKIGMCSCKSQLPKLHGVVVVLGAGDTAFDCATCAMRCGAKRVYIVFRKGFNNMRAVPEEVELAKKENCEFLPFCSPYKVNTNAQKNIYSLEFYRTEINDKNEWYEDKEQVIKIKCDYVISAFGSKLTDDSVRRAIQPLKLNKWGLPDIDPVTMKSSESDTFAGKYLE